LKPRFWTFAYSEAKTVVIRTSSEVDNQSAENKASNEDDYAKGQLCKKMRRKNIRLMMEKTNSAENISHWVIFFREKATEPTFPEVPDTKNIDETDKEAEDHSIASLVLMLVAALFQSPISMSEESTYIIVPESDKDGRSRNLYGDSDTVGSGLTKARSMQTLTLTLMPTGNLFQYSLVSDVCPLLT
jgi:hypothetical protein